MEHVSRDDALVMMCEAVARLLIDQLVRRDGASPDLTYEQQLHLIMDAMWAVRYRAEEIEKLDTVQVPAARREVPDAVRERIFARDGGCLKCGRADNLQIDHVIPIAYGGPHAESNFQTLCSTCNQQKGTRSTDYRLDAETVAIK